MYESTYHAGHATDAHRIDSKRRLAKERVAWLQPRSGRPESAFEIGCGEGALLAELRDLGLDVAGVEPGAEYAAFGRDHFGVPIDIGTFPGITRNADLVLAVHVIEHMVDPVGFLRSIRDAMTAAGACFVETPNLWKPRPARISANLLAAPHVIVFTPASIARAFAAAGLRIEHLDVGINLRVLARADNEGPVPMPPARPLAAYGLWREYAANRLEIRRQELRRVVGRGAARKRKTLLRVARRTQKAAARLVRRRAKALRRALRLGKKGPRRRAAG